MKTKVCVRWQEGLHLRPAARLVETARKFRSRIFLRIGSVAADATSIMSILVLCAGMNSILEVEAVGEDEQEALAAIESVFDGDAVEPSVAEKA